MIDGKAITRFERQIGILSVIWILRQLTSGKLSVRGVLMMKKRFDGKRLMFRILISLAVITICYLALRRALGTEDYVAIAVPRGLAAVALMWCVGLFDSFDPD